MRCFTTTDPAQYAERVLPWLSSDPVRHTVPATVLVHWLADRPGGLPSPLWSWVEVEPGAVAGVAFRTPPAPLGVYAGPAAATALADHLYAEGVRPPSLSGAVPGVDHFAQRWAQLSGQLPVEGKQMRLHELGELRAPPAGAGHARPARPAELLTIVDWTERFGDEANLAARQPRAVVEATAEQAIAERRLWVWADLPGPDSTDLMPVSMALHTRVVAGVARVNAVFTPPAYRRRGYAAGVVVAVSRHALDVGARACCLYTDALNHTAASLYARLGYHAIGSAREMRLTRAGPHRDNSAPT